MNFDDEELNEDSNELEANDSHFPYNSSSLKNPASCRRQFQSRPIMPRDFQRCATSLVENCTEMLTHVSAKPDHLNFNVDDISFVNMYKKRKEAEESDLSEEEREALKPKKRVQKHYLALDEYFDKSNFEKSTDFRKKVNTKQCEAIILKSMKTTGKFPQRTIQKKNKIKDKDHMYLNEVIVCMQNMSKKLHSVRDMITQRNIHTRNENFHYRDSLRKMYLLIAQHIEEADNKKTAGITKLNTTKKCQMYLNTEERKIIEDRIKKLENKMENKLIENVNVPEKIVKEINLRNKQEFNLTKEVVISIKIHYPNLLKAREFECLALGRHKLKQVLDLYTCPVDENFEKVNISLNPRYVFIEGTFFVPDDPLSKQETQNIRKFCQEKKCGWSLDVGRMTQEDYQEEGLDSSLSSIIMRASNTPLYIYSHHGSCEHLIQILDIRLAHATDPLDLKNGPVIQKMPASKMRKCSICLKSFANKITYGSALGLYDPCFWCEECYVMLHLDDEGRSSCGRHHVFPYLKD